MFISDINECETGSYVCDKHAMCEDNEGSYQCVCVTGYSGNGDTCSDINECQTSPCHVNANCTNTNGSYTCQCSSGFIGDGFDCIREYSTFKLSYNLFLPRHHLLYAI